jgi:septum formation protein
MAHAKAEAAAEPGAFVLAADTVVALGRRILPKPEDADGVRACLALLSGRRHQVLTALVLIAPSGQKSERISTTAVAFARLTPTQCDAYAGSGEGLGKAGGYAIQGRFCCFVSGIAGSYENVVGLPLCQVVVELQAAGVLPAEWPPWQP